MEIREFLKKFKTLTKTMSEEELREWLYDYARKLPESEQSHLLESLTVSDSDEAFDQNEMDQAIVWANAWLDDDEVMEKTIYYIQNVEVSDWDFAYEPGDEFEGIEDREGVLDEFARVLEIIEKVVKANQFEVADELLERLFQLEMRAVIIWKYDGSEIDEYFIYADDLFEGTAFDAAYYSHLWLYVIVQLTSVPNFTRLFDVMKQRKITEIDVIQTVGPHEVKVDEFIDAWIAFLAKTQGHEAYVLLRKACQSHKSMDFIEEHLAEFGQTHPLLFLDVLSHQLNLEYADLEFNAFDLKDRMQELSNEQIEEIKKVVKLAEDVMSKELILGAEVMEVGFELSKRLHDDAKEVHYRKQAFQYHSSIVNFLRLRTYLSEDERIIYKDNWAKSTTSGFRSFSALPHTNGLARNTLDDDQVAAQLFFTEQFKDFYHLFKEKKTPLGWSSNLLGFGVPLLLLLLNKTNEQSKAMKWMENYVTKRLVDSRRDRVYFSEAFVEFKKSTTLPLELEEEMIKWLGKQISARTKALLDNKHRNAYYRAAELIIAYGEVLESRGESGARARTAEQYRKKYNHFNRFTRELKGRL